MRKYISITLVIYLAMFLLPIVSHAQQYDSDGKWHYRFIPYIWFSGINGNVAVRGIPVTVDSNFTDLAQHLDLALQFHFEGVKNKWGYFIDTTYLKASADSSFNGTPVDVEFTQWLIEFGGMRRLWSQCRNNVGTSAVDLLLGGRYWNLNGDLKIDGDGTASESQNWIDPFIGASYTTDLSRLWGAYARFDIGGFDVGSKFTWSLYALLSYHTSPSRQLLFGYKILDVDRENGSGDNFFKYDVTLSGPIVGYSFNF